MKALSFSRPWDYVILHPPFKDIENRNWSTKFRGRIYVHRAKSLDLEGIDWMWDNRGHVFPGGQRIIDVWADIAYTNTASGGIVGEVDIVDCVSKSSSPWFFGRYGFVLANPVAYDEPIPYPGKQGLFDVRLCAQCKAPLFIEGKFCPRCSEVALEDDCYL